MAEENDKSSSQGARRFRLPKLFAEADESSLEGESEEFDAMNPQPPTSAPTGASSPASALRYSNGPSQEPSMEGSSADEILEYVAGMAQELLSLREKLSGIAEQVGEMNARESTQEKVFDTLHAELSDYKKDFIYEHLKPVVRPLLFLYDSLEQFDYEISQYERPQSEERRGLSPRLVRDNVVFFRDQLVEALQVCEVTIMETPTGVFNPKTQKAVGVETVDSALDNHIVRVVRSGWFLNGQLLRPAEIVVGRAPK
jgi:molecular chaperone GrpE (heat shock protein)